MKEKDINTIINNSFKQLGFSHKISDPVGGTGIQNPFDGFSVFHGRQWFWETKLLKGYQAFNFNKIEDHQLYSLSQINNHCSDNTRSLIIVGIWESRKFIHVYLFDYNYILKQMDSGKKSILKKDFERLYQQNKAVEVYKDKNLNKRLMDVGGIEGKIIL